MKHICLSTVWLLLSSMLLAQESSLEPWQDPEVNEVNRMAALHYTIDQLDDGIDKDKHILPCSHSVTLPEADCTNLCIDLIQQGQACIDSWAARPLDRYMVHAQDMEYSFRITPIVK